MNTNKPFMVFSHIFDGLIFKILADEVLPLLALEIRHTETKEVSFAVVDYQKKEVVFEGLGLEESWWVGMAGFYQGKLFFHSFADKQYPEPQGIIVADVLEQAIIWEKKGIYLEQISPQGAYISWIGESGKKPEILDIQTGNTIDGFKLTNEVKDGKNNNLVFPFQYVEKTPHFETVALFLKQKLAVKIIQQLDYLEVNNHIVISYLVESNKKITQFLLILSQNGEILFHQLLDNQVKGIQTEVFFVVNDFLISIANRKNLLIFKL
jgi:hypothetical protein